MKRWWGLPTAVYWSTEVLGHILHFRLLLMKFICNNEYHYPTMSFSCSQRQDAVYLLLMSATVSFCATSSKLSTHTCDIHEHHPTYSLNITMPITTSFLTSSGADKACQIGMEFFSLHTTSRCLRSWRTQPLCSLMHE